MHPNYLAVPTLLGALLFCLLGIKVSRLAHSPVSNVAVFSLAILLATPALLFAAYYGHFFDRAAWFYAFRAASFTELTASGIGFGLGLMLGHLKSATLSENSASRKFAAPILIFLCGAIVLLPYIKPVIAPLEVPLKGQWSNGVALQSTPATCGPSSAATILRLYGIPTTERELANECFTYRGGTENWYVARALQRRGLRTRYIVDSPQGANLPVPSIAGVQLGGPGIGGHFIAILGRSGDSYIIGDPLVGKSVLTAHQLHAKYYFTGFFLAASKS